MAVLFLEIGCEEIPARLQKKAIADLKKGLVERLSALGFSAEGGREAISPRHMAVEISGLAEQLDDRVTERRGPRSDAPDKAIDGFCHSVGLGRDQLAEQATEKGVFLFARITEKGAVLRECLPEILQSLLAEFPWPKSQRWARSRMSWVRPLRQVNLLIDGQPVEGQIDLGGDMHIAFGQQTQTHPFHAPEMISLSDFDSYLSDMEKGYVLVDHERRAAEIETQLRDRAAEKGLKPVADAGLLAETTGLVEWPRVICGRIDDDFMALPAEILVTSMRVHQKFFALSATGEASDLAPYFMTVANRKADAKTDQLIAAGNERVLRARLSDARFFWDQDRGKPLSQMASGLAKITFYEGLGSMADKAGRIAGLAEIIASQMKTANPEIARRAAELAKADLVSDMVGEFPELQGIMGGYYAAHGGEDEKIAAAIAQHYRPQGPADSLPQTAEGLAVSLADKLDTLTGFFGIDQKPTGSRDPFALRRAALGVIRMVDEADLRLDMDEILAKSAALHGFSAADTGLCGFILERLRVSLRDRGYGHDVIAAVLARVASGSCGDIRLLCRLTSALDGFLQTESGKGLRAGWRRVASILQAEEAKAPITAGLDAALFSSDAEKALYGAVSQLPELSVTSEEAIQSAMMALAELSAPINDFFDKVVVNSEEEAIRLNRLALLGQIRAAMSEIADFNQLEGA
ncbi:MAG: glycine--tRNA ligase subunit beta [Candidatus Puniceispirillaceae bacterium]